MKNKKFETYRFVKKEDLNHHGTLFAGRSAEWFVETGLMTTSLYVPADNIVMMNIHQMTFKKPIQLGSLIKCSGQLVYAGTSSFMVHLTFEVDGYRHVEGFISYVNVDENGKTRAHDIKLNLEDDQELIDLNKKAREFLGK